MGETLEYLEELADNGDLEELENCGESLNDWMGIEIKIPKKTEKT